MVRARTRTSNYSWTNWMRSCESNGCECRIRSLSLSVSVKSKDIFQRVQHIKIYHLLALWVYAIAICPRQSPVVVSLQCMRHGKKLVLLEQTWNSSNHRHIILEQCPMAVEQFASCPCRFSLGFLKLFFSTIQFNRFVKILIKCNDMEWTQNTWAFVVERLQRAGSHGTIEQKVESDS